MHNPMSTTLSSLLRKKAELDLTETECTDTECCQQQKLILGEIDTTPPTTVSLHDLDKHWLALQPSPNTDRSSPQSCSAVPRTDRSRTRTHANKRRKLDVSSECEETEAIDEQTEVASPLSQDVNHRVALRDQLVSAFLGSKCSSPQGIVNVYTSTIASWLTSLAKRETQIPLLERTISSFCLASLGASHKDEQATWVARTCYGHAVAALAKEFPYSSKKRDARGNLLVMISMRLLGFVEMFDEIRKTCSKDSLPPFERRAIHCRKLETYLLAGGATRFVETMRSAKPLELKLFNYLRFQSVLFAITARKASLFGSRQWSALKWDTEADEYQYRAFSDLISIATKLPAMLEKCDKLVGKQISAESKLRDKLKKQLKHLRSKLDAWLRKHPCELDIVSTDQDENNAREVFDEGSLVHDVYWSNNKKHCYCWLFCILIDCTLLKLGAMSPDPQPSNESLQLDIQTCMYALCRMEPSSSTGVGNWFLQLATGYFRHVGLDMEYHWCLDIKCSMDERSPKPQYDAKLCRGSWEPWTIVRDAAAPAKICLPGANDLSAAG